MTNYELAANFILMNADNDELNKMIEFIKMRRQQLIKIAVRSVVKGSKITFTSRGKTYNGTVTDVKIKNLVVETQYGRYRVPASMVKLVEEV